MKPNFVLWFMNTIAHFGGKYEPLRDFGAAKTHTSGRRETRIVPRDLSSRGASIRCPRVAASHNPEEHQS